MVHMIQMVVSEKMEISPPSFFQSMQRENLSNGPHFRGRDRSVRSPFSIKAHACEQIALPYPKWVEDFVSPKVLLQPSTCLATCFLSISRVRHRWKQVENRCWVEAKLFGCQKPLLIWNKEVLFACECSHAPMGGRNRYSIRQKRKCT